MNAENTDLVSEKIFLPGERVAVLEEYENGNNTVDDGSVVRSLAVGSADFDKKNRVVSIKKARSALTPKVGDVVIGHVVAVLANMFVLNIVYINGQPSRSGIEGICQTREYQKRVVARISDVVAAKVLSLRNGAVHITVNEPQLGVLFSQCIKCGSKVVRSGNTIKCTVCRYWEDRKLSDNFGSTEFLNY